MGIRRKARELALQLLFAQEREVMGKDAVAAFWESAESPELSRAYAETLSQQVLEHRSEIDKVITRYADNWTVDRMSRVDRNLLRLSVAELFYMPDVPVRVTLDEAVELAKRFGSDDSGRFVNGVLDRIARQETDHDFDDEAKAVPRKGAA
ncbi:MAG: transcription antitermination factor NusB [Leptospirillia bacterium]